METRSFLEEFHSTISLTPRKSPPIEHLCQRWYHQWRNLIRLRSNYFEHTRLFLTSQIKCDHTHRKWICRSEILFNNLDLLNRHAFFMQRALQIVPHMNDYLGKPASNYLDDLQIRFQCQTSFKDHLNKKFFWVEFESTMWSISNTNRSSSNWITNHKRRKSLA